MKIYFCFCVLIPNSCKKLFESVKRQPIIYRSSWEKKFILWCESCKNVKHWGSECTCIKYFNPVDQKTHRYFPDFVVEMQDGKVLIVEIKPENQTKIPDAKNSLTIDLETNKQFEH